MKVSHSDSNRIGKFRIMYELLNSGPDRPLLKALFNLCLTLEAFPEETGRGRMYVAASDLFEPLNEGDEIPEYRIVFAWPDQAFEDPEHENSSLCQDGFRFKAIRKIIVRVPPASFMHNAASGKAH